MSAALHAAIAAQQALPFDPAQYDAHLTALYDKYDSTALAARARAKGTAGDITGDV